MNNHSRSVSAALDMVEAAISSWERQAKAAKNFQEQQLQQQKLLEELQDLSHQNVTHRTGNPSNSLNIPINYPTSEQISSNRLVNEASPLKPRKIFLNDESLKKNSVEHHRSPIHKKSRDSKTLVSSVPSVLLHARGSSSRKKCRIRSSSKHHHRRHRHRSSSHSGSSRREKNNNDVTAESMTELEPKQHQKSDEKFLVKHASNGYAQATLSSKLKEKLDEKPGKKEKVSSLPFVPVGSQGKSFHVGIIIQKELGKLKSQPLDVWAAAKQNAARKEAEGSESASNILRRELTKS
ncbi:uncharacterized protein LOC108667759 [Hyalella azteca]|uniref:Uncharacterized protein LOC108667759 n=1 Tax=Hyalella azteca TaxID=294128 RepID=A0A8B7N9Y7_HYAAZ|nr:uncharacterized protein LOC108667759 [Hyalella azteca]